MASRPARRCERLPALIGVAAVHVAIGYALVVGLGVVAPPRLAETPLRLMVFDAPPPPPPPPRAAPRPTPAPRAAGGSPYPIAPPPAAPPTVPVAMLPAPVPIVPVPAPLAGGTSASGAGTAGSGSGAGSGAGSGSGSGSGGVFTEAEQVKGRFRNSDYPKSARGAGHLRTGVRYAVGPDGLVRDCTVSEPSGWPEVDAMTCRVITDRYRFRPARDAKGEAITQVIEEGYSWDED